DLFESVATNLLQNALDKRKAVGKLRIAAALQWNNGFSLRVTDDGEAISDALATQLFNAPVQSNSGLGVGLYQAAKFAKEQGYRLELEDNRRGSVCFVLRPAESRSGGR